MPGYFESFIGVNFWTALFTLLNFLVLFFVARKFLIGPILKIISDRQKEIDDLYADANQAKSNAEVIQAKYQQKLDAAQAASEQIMRDAVIRGQTREEEIIRQANVKASAMMDKAVSDIAQEQKKAINEAKNEISGIAVAIAEKVVGRELNATDQNKLVDDFIDGFGDGT